jgi:hypothetical protein
VTKIKDKEIENETTGSKEAGINLGRTCKNIAYS